MLQMELAHKEKMQEIQNEHEKEMLQERNRHEEAMYKQQCEIFKVAIEAASAAYEKKIDFYTAQLNCLENVYSKERDLLSEHIRFLEDERRQYINDANKYALVSSDITKLENQKNELYMTYLKSQGNLEDAIKYLEIDKSFDSNLNDMKNGLIGKG
jgi:cell division protein FtsB